MIDIFSILEERCSYTAPIEFYRDIFPQGELEKKGERTVGKYTAVAVSVKDKKVKRYSVTDDLDAVELLCQTDEFCIMSPISYAGKSRKSEFARFMYAMAIDLDGIDTEKQMNFLFTQVDRGLEMTCFIWGLPKPTYFVASGTGLHLYYVFEKPIPLFKNIVEELEKLKKRITWQAWTQGASSLHDSVQYESLFQGFRMPGTITKTGTRAAAYRYGDKVTVEYLNQFVPEEHRAANFAYKSALTLRQAKEKYPEWYEKRIVQKQKKGTWVCKKDLYYWWIRTLRGGAQQGHRYWCMMALATYAKKCGVSREELERDAFDLLDFMNSIGDEPFTEDDILAALEAYNDSYITYPIDAISVRCDIEIAKNKRNWRKQSDHIKLMNFVRDEINGNTDWRNKNGRPKGSGTAQAKVQKWRYTHPDGKKADCIRETGLSKPTVYKWWDVVWSDAERTVEIRPSKEINDLLIEAFRASGKLPKIDKLR